MKKNNVLILLCTLTSFFYWSIGTKIIDQFFVFKATDFFYGKFWTPITALFIHADPVHLIGNMLFLYVFGNTLEEIFGGGRTASAFFLGGIFSFILSVPFYDQSISMIGASAAIFTLTSAAMLTKPLKFSWLFLMPLGLVAMLHFLYNLLAVYYGIPGNIGYAAHVIGFLMGIPFGIAWNRSKWIQNLLITILLLLMYVFLIRALQFFRLL